MCQQRQAPHVATWQGSEAQVKRNAKIAAHIAAVEKELNRVKK
ncbi:MAG TPA: hypothetical protein PLC01_09115 [Methylotenera sp.]|nr:hypothetical protein [Methylotenera sp.]